MRSYEERAKDFIAEVFPYLGGCNDPWDVQSNIREYNAKNTRNVKVHHGIARIALITSDYVVKYTYDEYEADSVGGGEEEISLYQIAELEGFAYLLAKITRYEYMGKKFYIMPRIRGISDRNYYHAEHFMTDAERRWCNLHHLSDLHCNNYGFRKGHVCLVDYACTLEETSCSSEYDSDSEVSES